MPLFSKDPKNCLGIDIGATSIKIVELSKKDGNISLTNYGIASIKDITGRSLSSDKGFSSSIGVVTDTVNKILDEARMKTKRTVFSIPDFNSFFTAFEVPKMKKSEVESAIQYQARQRIPLPLNEVTLDWNLTNLVKKGEEEMVEVLLLAVPNDTIKAYRAIAKKTGLEVGSLDAETFGLARVYGEKKKTVVVADIGHQTTTVNIIEDEVPKHSHSLDLAGKDFTKDVAILPEVNYNEESEKKEQASEVSNKIKKSLSEEMIKKIQEVCDSYESGKDKNINKLIITGGGTNFDEIREMVLGDLNAKEGNSFKKIEYPSVLEPIINDLSPLFSVSIGMALEGLKRKK